MPDAYRFQVYQYEDAWLVCDGSGVRRLKAVEAARMMGINSWHFKLVKLKFTEDEMGQAVGNMFSPLVAARLLCGLLPEARCCSENLTEHLWQSWLKSELVDDKVLSEYTSGLPWLPPRLLACSLRSQLGWSAAAGGGQVQSWMMEQGSVHIATKAVHLGCAAQSMTSEPFKRQLRTWSRGGSFVMYLQCSGRIWCSISLCQEANGIQQQVLQKQPCVAFCEFHMHVAL